MFHLFLPQMRMSHAAIVERAKAAEVAGFEGIAFMDHMAPPMALEHDMWEAMAIAGWVLAHTSTLIASHLVLCDSLRHPAMLAREVTSLDHASGGRFELGIGWGSMPSELETFGIGSTEAPARVGRLGESLEIIRALWSGETVDYQGEYFTLVAAQQRPVPTRPIPITIGGTGKRTLALVKQHAHWWNVPVHQLEKLDEMRPGAGDAQVSTQIPVCVVENEAERAAAIETARRRFGRTAMATNLVVGTTEELVDYFGGQRARGIDRFYVWFADFAPVATLEKFAKVTSAFAG